MVGDWGYGRRVTYPAGQMRSRRGVTASLRSIAGPAFAAFELVGPKRHNDPLRIDKFVEFFLRELKPDRGGLLRAVRIVAFKDKRRDT